METTRQAQYIRNTVDLPEASSIAPFPILFLLCDQKGDGLKFDEPAGKLRDYVCFYLVA